LGRGQPVPQNVFRETQVAALVLGVTRLYRRLFGKENVRSSRLEILMRPPGILVIAVLLGFFCSRPAVAEEQLPINELDACEIVLHELIADLTRVQRTSRHESMNSHDEEPVLYNARHQATEEAFAQAIRLARAKYGRCP
jgi:hypothetical protein